MTTIKEFKKFLEQFPEDTEVEVLISKDGRGWDAGKSVYEVPFDGEEYSTWSYVYFHGNQFVKPNNPCYNKKILTIGSQN